MFPRSRPRRLRSDPTIRRMVRENTLSADDLIGPVFVNETLSAPSEVRSMPGVIAHTPASVVDEARRLEALNVPAVLLFGVPERKDKSGSQAWDRNSVVQGAVRDIKGATDLTVITDLCLCEYTSHGHCGVLRDGSVDNDLTLELYARTAVAQAQAGADIVAPSGMMDGQVMAVRDALDDAGFENVAIMAYAAKYASAFYGPFRDAAHSAPSSGDRRTHQMDLANAREAMREMRADLAEGADVLMVKPALPCLDIIALARRNLDVPLAAYQVSGEYAMLKAAAANGWLDGKASMMESLLSIKRAGADMIITYFAAEAAEVLRGIE
ncbi:delta-aminolevulinic acid dehydratase [Methanomassiliicoccales archaeon RumEn M1]|nr:delta-aminolevulinic acid dehydratase [Methanomassiliicoccales archaeon RumEn M1]